MNRQEKYRFTDNVTPLSADELNARFFDLDTRLGSIEAQGDALPKAIADFNSAALSRINDVLLPAFQSVAEVQRLGFLNAPIAENTAAVFALGLTTVVIAVDRRSFFTPSPWVVLVRDASVADYVVAHVLSYSQDTGVLQLDVDSLAGTPGTYTDVTVWGVAGGALTALENGQGTRTDRVAAESARDAAAGSASSAATSAAYASSAAGSAGISAGNARTSEANAATYAQAAQNAVQGTTMAVTSVNGKQGPGAISLGAADVGAVSSVNGHGGAVTLGAADVGAVASVNGKTGAAISLAAADVGALAPGRNLADLADAPTARTNLGLGAAATKAIAALADWITGVAGRVLTTDVVTSGAQPVVIPWAATTNVDLNTFLSNAVLTLGGATVLNFQNTAAKKGFSGLLEIYQPAAGGYAVTLTAGQAVFAGSAPAVDTGASARTLWFWQVLSDGKVFLAPANTLGAS